MPLRIEKPQNNCMRAFSYTDGLVIPKVECLIFLQRYYLFSSYQNLECIFFFIFKIIKNDLCFISAYCISKSLNISFFYLFDSFKCLD